MIFSNLFIDLLGFNCIDSILNLVNFLHEFSFAVVSGFSLDVGPAAQQSAGELGLGAVVPGHQGCHAVSRRDKSLVVHATFVAEITILQLLTQPRLPP